MRVVVALTLVILALVLAQCRWPGPGCAGTFVGSGGTRAGTEGRFQGV